MRDPWACRRWSHDAPLLRAEAGGHRVLRQAAAAVRGEHAGTSVVHDSTAAIAPQFVRGEPADVGCFNDNLELARYISRGVLSDLGDLPSAARVRPDIDTLTNQYATFEDRTSVLPYCSLAAAGVIYNKRIFADHDLPVPTTWDDFRRGLPDPAEGRRHAGSTPPTATRGRSGRACLTTRWAASSTPARSSAR
ncbi:extracellular solute-binding protein [Curtobacterium flaccumfaciens]|nr:extracellular solute-binding protein [Curtobacterium flaccumfaciens]